MNFKSANKAKVCLQYHELKNSEIMLIDYQNMKWCRDSRNNMSE